MTLVGATLVVALLEAGIGKGAWAGTRPAHTVEENMNEITNWISANLGELDLDTTLVISLITIVVSILTARKYGDTAGTKAAIAFEKKREHEAQRLALYALLNQAGVAKELAVHNLLLEYPNERRAQPVVRMPVNAFETAFLTGKDSILAKLFPDIRASGYLPNPMVIISKYLIDAYAINTLVDIYLSLAQTFDASHTASRDDALKRLKEDSAKVVETLNEMERLLVQLLKTVP